MVEVSSDAELTRTAARANDGAALSSASVRNGSESAGSGTGQPHSPSAMSNCTAGSSSPPVSVSPTPQRPRSSKSPSPSATIIKEESSKSEVKLVGSPSPPQRSSPPSSVSSSQPTARPHEPVTTSSASRVTPAPPPLVRNRPALAYQPLAVVSDRVATMASNASSAFDSGLQRLQHNQQQRATIGVKTVDLVNASSKQAPPVAQYQPQRQAAPPPPSQQKHYQHQQSRGINFNQHPTAFKPTLPSTLQKPIRPHPVRAYDSTSPDHQQMMINKVNQQQSQQRSPFNSSTNIADIREFMVQNHHLAGGPISVAAARHHQQQQQQQQQVQRPTIRVLEDFSRKVDVVPTLQPLAERTRNGSSIQDVTRELSELVRFPSRHHQQQAARHEQPIRFSAEDLEKCKKDYERAYRSFVEARDRLAQAQQIVEHNQHIHVLASEHLRQQEHKHHQELSSQPTLQTLLLSDPPPQKRPRLSPTNSSHDSHNSPPSAPPAPQHLSSPQLPLSRHRSEETPIDLSHARGSWPQVGGEDAWRVSPNPTSPPQFHIRVLSPPEAAAVAASNAAAARNDPGFLNHIKNKIRGAYRPLVDPVSPPRPQERSPSPSYNRPSPANHQSAGQVEPEIIHIQHQDLVRVSPQHISAERVGRPLHPGGAVLHQRPVAPSQPSVAPNSQSQPAEITPISTVSSSAPRRPQNSKAQCLRCHRPSGFVCSSCKLATYCSTNCQTQHWSEHEQECHRICHLTRNIMSGRPQN